MAKIQALGWQPRWPISPHCTTTSPQRHCSTLTGRTPSDRSSPTSRAAHWWLTDDRAPEPHLCCGLVLILGLILFGMLVGAGAQLIVGKSAKGIDWTLALVAGLIGSFVGGLLISLLSGEELQLQPSGIVGSLIGALVVTAVWQWYRRRSKGSHA
jgi:uncharacterized membrane protein YeaQ/YmgE (transglycosylase-associated protein family)